MKSIRSNILHHYGKLFNKADERVFIPSVGLPMCVLFRHDYEHEFNIVSFKLLERYHNSCNTRKLDTVKSMVSRKLDERWL